MGQKRPVSEIQNEELMSAVNAEQSLIEVSRTKKVSGSLNSAISVQAVFCLFSLDHKICNLKLNSLFSEWHERQGI